MSFIFTIDRHWGGIYIRRSTDTTRICFGFIAVTIVFFDISDILREWIEFKDRQAFLQEELVKPRYRFYCPEAHYLGQSTEPLNKHVRHHCEDCDLDYAVDDLSVLEL